MIREELQHHAPDEGATAETNGVDADQPAGHLPLGIRPPRAQDAAVPGRGQGKPGRNEAYRHAHPEHAGRGCQKNPADSKDAQP